ncbi:predicted protein, partial [Nematostella vectensis]
KLEAGPTLPGKQKDGPMFLWKQEGKESLLPWKQKCGESLLPGQQADIVTVATLPQFTLENRYACSVVLSWRYDFRELEGERDAMCCGYVTLMAEDVLNGKYGVHEETECTAAKRNWMAVKSVSLETSLVLNSKLTSLLHITTMLRGGLGLVSGAVSDCLRDSDQCLLYADNVSGPMKGVAMVISASRREAQVKLYTSTFNYSLISNGTNTSSSGRSTASIHQEVRLVSLLLVVIIGLSLNLSVISLVMMKQVPRRNINLLVANMALSDFLSLLLEPSYLLLEITGNLPWIGVSYLADVTCKLFAFMVETSTWVSLVTLLVISVERFRAVSCVIHLTEKRSVLIILLLVCWVLPGLLNSGGFASCGAKNIGGTSKCVRFDTMQSARYNTAINIIFILLVIVILCLNLAIIRKLVRCSQEAIHIPKAQQQKRARRFRSATRMVLSSLLLFVFCATPLYTLLTIKRMEPLLGVPILSEWSGNMINAVVVLFFVNPAASPIIYFVFLGDFRKVLRKFCCRKKIIGQPNADYHLRNEEPEELYS